MNAISMYPNPAKNILNLVNKEAENCLVEILSIDGKVLQRIPLNATAQKSIHLDQFANGFYLVRFTNQLTNEIKVEKPTILK